MSPKRHDVDGSFAVGSKHIAHVQRLDASAAAIALTETGRKVRVPRGVPGDTVQVEIVARGRKEIWTRLLRIDTPSKDRIDAPCKAIDRCGLCPWQNLKYREQLSSKGRILRELIHHQPAFASVPVHDPVGISSPLGYRTKVQMPAGGLPGALKLGFYAPRSHDFVAIQDCVVQHPVAEHVRHRVIGVLNRHQIAPYNEQTHSGDLRTVLVRVAEGTGQVAVVVVVRSYESVDWALLANELVAIEDVTGVWANENSGTGNAVLGPRTVHLGGARRLEDRIAGVTLQRTPTSFFQTNHRATELLVRTVSQMMPTAINTLLDLYGGGGLFSAMLADRTNTVHLIESNPDALASAKATLNDRPLQSATMHLGTAEDKLRHLLVEKTQVDAIVADPPRAGMSPDVIQSIHALDPKALVVVSCHPKRFVRDLAALQSTGYRLREVRSVDMFPHTHHLEAVGLLTR